MRLPKKILALHFILILLLSSCASTRTPVPVGVVPTQAHTVSAEDEDYGHRVLALLTRQYPLDRDDQRINRVRDIVYRLADAASASHNPWHSYVLVGDDVKNAAATKGNMIFVWTGMLRAVQDDDELATIVAHEMAHVLAGHTQPDPAEAANQMITGIAAAASREALIRGTKYGAFADLAELLVSSAARGLILNPELQRIELEADQIGLFLMADAGYNPASAVSFWNRVQADPSFTGAPVQFLSSHPSSALRLQQLRENLPAATRRYQAAIGRPSNIDNQPPIATRPQQNQIYPDLAISAPELSNYSPNTTVPGRAGTRERWVVMEPSINVYASPNSSSRVVEKLTYNTSVNVISRTSRWLEISSPVAGFVPSMFLAPAD